MALCLLGLGMNPTHSTFASETVVRWDFSRTSDLNFDNVPDGWQRVYGREYPRYLNVEIRPHDVAQDLEMRSWDATVLKYWRTAQRMVRSLPTLPPSIADAVVNRYLSATIDGGGIRTYSPSFPVGAEYSYLLQGRIKTDGLVNNKAWMELNFLDAKGKEISSLSTGKFTGSQQWTQIHIGPVTAPTDAVSGRITLRFETGERADMTGAVGFDDILVNRLPRIRILAEANYGLYSDPAEPKIRCFVSGLSEQYRGLRFRLLDENGKEIRSHLAALQQVSEDSFKEIDPSGSDIDDGYGGVAEWQLPRLGPGFYRVRADLTTVNSDAASLEYNLLASPKFGILVVAKQAANAFDVEYSFAVLSALPPTSSPFGWSLANSANKSIPIKALPEWLTQCRVHWLKYPCWVAPADTEKLEAIAWLMNRLQDRSIRSVGVLSDPPAEVLTNLEARDGDPVALLFRDKSLWQPQLEPVMTRLSNGVRWWQLGRDSDYSFLGRAQLSQTITDIRTGLQGFGQPIQIAINWPWIDPLPPRREWTWHTVCLNDPTPQTADEINAYFSAETSFFNNSYPDTPISTSKRTDSIVEVGDNTSIDVDNRTTPGVAPTNPLSNIQPWIILDPLPRNRYRMTERIRDLILRMIAVRAHNIQAAFVSNPFEPGLAMIRQDGTPDEMLLPWRTSSALIGMMKPVGSLQLQSRSHNILLVNETDALLVLWSDTPTTETLFIGDDARHYDAFGRRIAMVAVDEKGSRQHRLSVSPEPTFVVGIDRVAALWNMSVELDRKRIDSLLGREQIINVRMQNPATQTISGNFKVDAPESWTVGKFARPLTAEPLRERSEQVPLVLKLDATIGRERLAIDFELDGDRARQFTVYRDIEVGPEDIEITVSTRLLADGRLVVRQELTSLTNKTLQFDNSVYAPGRQRQRRTTLVPPLTQVQQEFVWTNGEELIGQLLLLRAEELDGQRTLNFRFNATR